MLDGKICNNSLIKIMRRGFEIGNGKERGQQCGKHCHIDGGTCLDQLILPLPDPFGNEPVAECHVFVLSLVMYRRHVGHKSAHASVPGSGRIGSVRF